MAKFKYIAVDAKGKESKGTVQAADSRSAIALNYPLSHCW